MTSARDIDDLLCVWFGDLAAPPEANRTAWFRADAAHDRLLATRFGALVDTALAGGLVEWSATANGALARVLLLDQLPRNLFRGSARAFDGDALARAAARTAIDAGIDTALPPIARVFLYLPFEHAESRTDQRLSLALFRALVDAAPDLADFLHHATEHAAIVERFGRFPHRNAILGRNSSAAETEFLEQDRRRFGQ